MYIKNLRHCLPNEIPTCQEWMPHDPTLAGNLFRKYRFIVATHLDGKPMPLGGLGPLWAIFDADRFPDMAARKVTERFALCPWALYHIDLSKG